MPNSSICLIGYLKFTVWSDDIHPSSDCSTPTIDFLALYNFVPLLFVFLSTLFFTYKDQTVFIQSSTTPTTATATRALSIEHNTMPSGNNADLMAHNSQSGGISTALVYKICQTGARVKPRVQYPPIDDSLDDLCLDLDWEKFVADELGGISRLVQLAIAILWVPFLVISLPFLVFGLYLWAKIGIKILCGYLVRMGTAIRKYIVLPEEVFPGVERKGGSRKKCTIRILDLDDWVH
ncbi:uncharacterized protein BKA78DRAFT_6545 [Phyllosticta capitalensis]|uniref:uncharacterized protein n=1 Tax=Phyllosticta capitalensis TaxID=121624 RepID=UPI00313259F3